MTAVQLRAVGTTATYAPVIKRGVTIPSDLKYITMMIDTNLASSGGTDVTGVAKIHLYVSDTTRTTWTLAASLTPAVAPASSTRAARAAMTIGSDNSVWVAWQGVDNGLYVSRWSYAAGVLTFVATETVVASGSITDRFRTVDIDLVGTATALVTVYEAAAATGSGAFHRGYVRNNSATWIRAFSITALATGQFIRSGSEDVSGIWRLDGVVSNVARILVYGTKTHTTADLGDIIREYSFNVSTGTTDSATVLGTWSTAYNINQAAGTRRAILYSLTSTVYLIAGVVGAGVPKFFAIKLTTGNYSTPGMVNVAGYVSSTALSNYFQIDPSYNNRTYWATAYRDNRLVFGFVGVGTGSAPRILREVTMTWPSIGAVGAAATVDLVPRPTDSAYYGNGGPIAIYGGDNRGESAGQYTYNFAAIYGPSGNAVSTASSSQRVLRFVNEDTFDAPYPISPASIEPTARPTYRIRVENVNLEPNLYGKIELNIATDSAFTTNLKTITQADSELQYFGSKDGLSGGSTQVSVATPGPTQALTQGTWYWRARVVSDKGRAGAWSSTYTFTVSHPPTALPTYPGPASTVAKSGTNSYTFTWAVSDTNPDDTQTAYRLVIRRLDTLVTVLDTGFVTSSITSSTQTIDTTTLGIDEVALEWSVQLKDADGITGPLSDAIQFTIGSAPVIAITSPTDGSTVTTALPTVAWTFSGSGGRTQRAYRVSIYDTTGVMGTDPVVTTGWRTGTVNTYTFTSQVLVNSNPYNITLDLQDTGGLVSTTDADITTAWTSPLIASDRAVTTPDEFKHRITWSNADQDPDWVSYRVYRRYMTTSLSAFDVYDSASTWYLLYETDTVAASYTFDDYLAPLNKQVEYAVVQLVDRFGSLIESVISGTLTATQTADRYFFVPEVNIGGIASFEASGVTGDNFSRDIEQETLHVIGRGRQVQIGDDLGYSGTLTIKLRNPSTARRDREFFELISSQYNKVYVKTPFGDVVLIALGNVSTTRQAGYGGYADFADLSVPYTQIIDDSMIARSAA